MLGAPMYNYLFNIIIYITVLKDRNNHYFK